MSSLQNYVPVVGSERTMRHNARVMGPANPKERIEVTVRVRKRKDYPSIEEMGALKPKDRQYLSRKEVETNYGATDDDLTKIEDFANKHHLTVISRNKAERNVKLSGTVQNFSEAFQVKLMQYEHPGGTYRGRTGQIHIHEFC